MKASCTLCPFVYETDGETDMKIAVVFHFRERHPLLLEALRMVSKSNLKYDTQEQDMKANV